MMVSYNPIDRTRVCVFCNREYNLGDFCKRCVTDD